MKPVKLSIDTIKKSTAAHSSLGLATAALLYLMCLTGTLSVFFEEFERWEQPTIEEYQHYTSAQIHAAIENARLRLEDKSPKTLWVVLPTQAVPRMHVSAGGQEWFVNTDGTLSEPPLTAWTSMMTGLHTHLQLPQNLGTILVGILGVVLCSLVLSGLLSHPRLFRDAFRWRLGRQALTQVDLHNRLAVWSAPFILAIAVTGAFTGLMGVFGALTSSAFYNNDIQEVLEVVYGSDPVIPDATSELRIDVAFKELQRIAPAATPFYLAVQKIGSKQQYIEIGGTLPQRLIYSEVYRFRANGSFIDRQGFSDGDAGKQIAYSAYRLHFGHYSGFWVKLIYGLLGLALTVICASGINIWLARRKHESVLNDLWVALVWGLPLALSFSALMAFYGVAPLAVFLSTQVFATAFALLVRQPKKARWWLLAFLLITLCIVAFSRVIPALGQTLTPVFYPVNLLIILAALVVGFTLFFMRNQAYTKSDKQFRRVNITETKIDIS